MSCPRCGNDDPNKFWDDNLWWGCEVCGYAANDEGGTMAFAKDIEGLPTTVEEVNRQAGWAALDYLPKLIPNEQGNEDENGTRK